MDKTPTGGHFFENDRQDPYLLHMTQTKNIVQLASANTPLLNSDTLPGRTATQTPSDLLSLTIAGSHQIRLDRRPVLPHPVHHVIDLAHMDRFLKPRSLNRPYTILSGSSDTAALLSGSRTRRTNDHLNDLAYLGTTEYQGEQIHNMMENSTPAAAALTGIVVETRNCVPTL